MLRWIVVILLLCFSLRGLTDQLPDKLSLNQQSVEALLGPTWRGILFVCSPYCRFLSLKEDDIWSPPIPAELVKSTDLKTVASSDPLYPLLIQKEPVLPYVRNLNGVKVKGGPEKPTSQNSEPPEGLALPFDFTWSLSYGLGLYLEQFKSDTVIQSDFESDGPVFSGFLSLDLIKGKPINIFGLWTQISGILNLESTLLYPVKAEEVKPTRTRYGVSLLPSFIFWKKKFQLGYILDYEQVAVPSDVLGHYGWTRQNSWLRIGHDIWDGWNFNIDYLLGANISEKQSFRMAPLRLTAFRLGGSYCSGKLSLFDLKFTLCQALSYLDETQVSNIDENLFSNKQSNIKMQNLELKVGVKIGEDFF